ncbi:BZ3500_MvSof-1268-A1-R1_Chr11-3g03492 [Microbotryum saponariae]|nr:BZ3500_MvSof-1268-A1-R1_Chr11-3g03492 [Microbotryum saponariae]SDA03491.1 BZ3501_MvSof-1269-A2-R1_Chr11g03069 [Microbotryum saponariae]
MCHRPSEHRPSMTPVVRNLHLVAPDRPAHQHSTMVDKFPLVSAVQHSPS